MNTTLKIILVIVAGAALTCALLGAGAFLTLRATTKTLDTVFEGNPAKAEDMAASIASYSLPAGFGDPSAAQLAGVTFVSYTGEDGHSHIQFFQLPAGVQLDPVEIEKQMRSSVGAAGREGPRDAKVVDRLPAKIAGQDVTLVVSEGINSDGQPFREVIGMFQGKGGQALVVYETPVSSWDQAQVDAFIASIQ